MCSLTITNSLANQLDQLGNNQAPFIRDNMVRRAHAAKVDLPGVLDGQDTHLKSGFAQDLKDNGVRYERVGRHRVYFFGHHTGCNYTAFYVKAFKRKENKEVDDNSPAFHTVLRKALKGSNAEVVADPYVPVAFPDTTVPDYKLKGWWNKNQEYASASTNMLPPITDTAVEDDSNG